jgi:hypothetical protein
MAAKPNLEELGSVEWFTLAQVADTIQDQPDNFLLVLERSIRKSYSTYINLRSRATLVNIA